MGKNMKDIVLVGFGGHGKSVADTILRMKQYHIVGYTELQEMADAGYPYLGTDEKLEELYQKGVPCAAVCVGYLGKGTTRDKLYQILMEIGYELPVIADPSAVISKSAVVGEGSFIGKNAVINAGAGVGKMTIINTGAIVEHECRIEDFSHIAVGAVLCGQSCVGDHVLVGAGSVLIQNVQVGRQAVIAAGTTVLHDVAEGQTYYGLGR